MIAEHMLELIILTQIIGEDLYEDGLFYFNGKDYNYDKILDRYFELKNKFLEPYAINTNPKG